MYVIGMGRKANYAAMRDVQIECNREKCVSGIKRYSYDGTFQDHRPTHPLPPTNFTSVRPLVVYPNHTMPPPNHNYHGYHPPVHYGNGHFIRPALPYPYPVSRMPIHYAPILLSKALPSDKMMASVDNLDDTAANK